ncbi:TolC family protein [Flavitalea sp. BT771]|uniref:TolC family protein n=1 Tax=Flavitalea sp. BT771 TaxID=3063329 RepID=UPI0026E2730B|nr:TolC family protein [Flavitalea sp. BT771]MDO6433747.1 TolC family protein [Flavitalea sp. BT771]MDV6222348.1 TolC family protein [Flavitalea sp. BT771]
MNRRFNIGRMLMAVMLAFPALTAWTQQAPNGQASGAAQGPQLHEFSLTQAIDYAAKNSVMVRNALLDLQIQQQSNRATTSQALPQITGNLGLTDNVKIPTTLIPGEFIGQPAGTFVPLQFGTQYNANAGITLKQVLFDGQVFVGLQARQASLDFYQKKQEVTEQMLRANIEKVYYQLLISKSQIAQIDANITNQQELLHNSTEMFKNGFAEQLDVDRSNVQLANLQTEKIQLELNISNGYLGLKVLMGMPVKDSLRLTDSLTYDMIRDATLSDDYKYADRRDFQLLQVNKKLNEYDISRYKKMYIPTANLTANYSQNQFSNKFDLTQKNSWFPSAYIGLNISVPIFDGFFKDANVKQAKLRLRQTENNIDSMKIRIDNDVKQAQLRFSAALATLDFQKKNMDLSDRVYAQTRKKYDQGLGSNTEITTALADQKTAQANYFNALYSAIVARVDYLNAIGKL